MHIKNGHFDRSKDVKECLAYIGTVLNGNRRVNYAVIFAVFSGFNTDNRRDKLLCSRPVALDLEGKCVVASGTRLKVFESIVCNNISVRDDDNVIADRADLGEDMARNDNRLESAELADQVSDLDDLRGVTERCTEW